MAYTRIVLVPSCCRYGISLSQLELSEIGSVYCVEEEFADVLPPLGE